MMMGAAKKKWGPQTAYAQGVLDEAIQMVQTGQMSVWRASMMYSIPKSMLNDYVTGMNGRKHSSKERKGKRKGQKKVC